jgi:hypothetical protein
MRPPRETGLVTGVVVAPTYAAGGVSAWIPSALERTRQGQMVADVAGLLDHRQHGIGLLGAGSRGYHSMPPN